MQIGKLIILVLVLVAAVAEGSKNSKMPKQTQITVTDVAGRQVKVAVPVERMILGMAVDWHVVAALSGKKALKKIVGMGSDLKRYDLDIYQKYKEKFPEIEAIPDVGTYHGGTVNIEKVIALKPDVFIVPLSAADREETLSDIARLEEAGIPTVIIDFSIDPFKNTIPSILLLGTLLGEEKRTQEIVDFNNKQVNKVISRLQKIDKPKPKVYVECGWKGSSEYGGTSGNVSWGAYVVKVGGINIAEGIVKRWGPINPEYLFKANPDVIIITGSHWETPGSMRLGYYANAKESRQLLKAYTERPGWSTLNAVKNGRVYSIFQRFVGQGVYSFVVFLAFAKWFYPDEFKDLDPEKIFKEFHKKYLPVDYSGVWMIGIKD